jgi:hypothetical protein
MSTHEVFLGNSGLMASAVISDSGIVKSRQNWDRTVIWTDDVHTSPTRWTTHKFRLAVHIDDSLRSQSSARIEKWGEKWHVIDYLQGEDPRLDGLHGLALAYRVDQSAKAEEEFGILLSTMRDVALAVVS